VFRDGCIEIDAAMKRLLVILLLLGAAPLFGQSDTGELRLKVTDPSGAALESSVDLVSEANHVSESFSTDAAGRLVAKSLPFGIYRLEVRRSSFAPASQLVEIRSAIPLELHVALIVAPLNTSVVVKETETLVDPYRTGKIDRIDSATIGRSEVSLPGRSVIDLVNSQPGWLLEANGVLHPRGSEYQTQFVVNGIPFTDNRSPSFAPEMEAGEVESISVMTSDFPAEYGRKLGGVIEVNTFKDFAKGLHGEFVASGGSFGTADGIASAQFGWGRNTLAADVGGALTSRYLDPPVPGNFTNQATTGNFGMSYSRDFTGRDRVNLVVLHDQARFLVPNENLQQAAGQRQDRATNETDGMASYQHVFSSDALLDVRGMVRDLAETLSSNPLSTPIVAAQDRGFREGYAKGALSVHHGRNEIKAGVELDFASIREEFSYLIADPAQFDPDTPSSFRFLDRAPDREQAAFVQDLVRLGRWTVSAGVRWDHYHLLVDRNAASLRLGVSWYWPRMNTVFHASYDRVFQTPASENLLLSSSPEILTLSPDVLRLPVRPSLGNFFEVGLTKGFFGNLRLDLNSYSRAFSNYADDDLLLNTGISFPIAFRKAEIYGAEAKLELPHWGRASGYLSYSYMLGVGYTPVTGGLFLGDDAATALSDTGRFPVSQDQRNTVSARFRYQLIPKLWLGFGGQYGSGLPTEFDGTPQEVIEQYGQATYDRIDFARGRVRPSLSLDFSVGADLWKQDKRSVRLQADVHNLNDRLNVINFAGLFSGTAIAPPRSYALRLTTQF
jgi:outer membrane cobalamin receptor